MDLPVPLDNLEDAATRLNKQMPPGLTVLNITLSNGSVPQRIVSSYRITLKHALTKDDNNRFKDFLTKEEFLVSRIRKRKLKQINIRPLLTSLQVINKHTLALELISIASTAGVKPLEAVAAILGKEPDDFLTSVVIKTGWKEL
jgi:hypothetical protein